MADTAIKRILIFDDDADFRKLLTARLGKQFKDAELEEYDPVARGVPGDNFDWSRYDVLLLDYYLCIHGVTGLDILQANRKNRLFPATIMLTGAGNEEVAVRALKAGVYDYIRKEKLDKEQLRSAIIDAFEKHKSELERLNELTVQSHAFNKALFYQQLEEHQQQRDQRERILLLINLDNHQAIEERAGLILRDNIIRHIARQSYEIFQLGECNPNITRFSDISIALLIDDPDSDKTLAFNLQGLCNHLKKRPYKYEDKKFRFTVSIGVVRLRDHAGSAEAVIRAAKEGCVRAEQEDGNSYHVFRGSLDDFESRPAGEEKQEPAAAPAPPETAPATEEVTPIGAEDDTPQPSSKPGPEEIAPANADATSVQAQPDEEETLQAAGDPPVEAEEETAPEPQSREEETAQSATGPAAADEAEPESDLLFPDVEKPAPPVEPPAGESAGAEPAPAPAPGPEKPAAAPAREAKAPPPPPPAEKPKKPAPARDDAELVEAELGQAALAVKRAFDEKRVTQTFQPVISLFSGEEESTGESEMHYVSLQMLKIDGTVLGAQEVLDAADSPVFRKYIDRWMLREAIGRVVNSSGNHLLVIHLSRDSLADPSLFNWLRSMLAGFDKRRPGRSIALEIDATAYADLEKPAGALMSYLEKSHDFKFVLGNINKEHDIGTLCAKSPFSFLRLDHEILGKAAQSSDNQVTESAVSGLKARGLRFIADNIEDAMTLTTVIGAGADYARGMFIGEPAELLEDQTSVESLEIV